MLLPRLLLNMTNYSNAEEDTKTTALPLITVSSSTVCLAMLLRGWPE